MSTEVYHREESARGSIGQKRVQRNGSLNGLSPSVVARPERKKGRRSMVGNSSGSESDESHDEGDGQDTRGVEVSPRSSDSGSGLKSSKQVSITNDRNEVDTSEKSDLQDRLSVVQNFAQISLSGHLNSSRVCEHSVRVFEKKILRRGWLARRSGRGISFWRKKWCVLRGTYLMTYAGEFDESPTDTILLSGCRMDALSALESYQFSVLGGKDDILELFRAKSFEEAREWVAAIGVAVSASVIEQPVQSTRLSISLGSSVTKIILVRHGHYVSGGTHNDEAGLSEIGRRQAEATGNYLRDLCSNGRNPSVVIPHSTLARAEESAHIIANSFDAKDFLEESELLVEGWPGPPFVVPQEKKKNTLSNRQMVQLMVNALRMSKAFSTYFVRAPDDPESLYKIVVCHANIIRYFICKILGVPCTEVWGQMDIHHCGLTTVYVYEDGSMKLVHMNEIGHLPDNLRTTSQDAVD